MPQTLKSLKTKLIAALKPYQPQKIYIYGSYARGEAKRDSDLDLLIIKNTTKQPRQRLGDVYSLIYSRKNLENSAFNVSIEPIVYTPREFEIRKKINDSFIKELVKDAQLIYYANLKRTNYNHSFI